MTNHLDDRRRLHDRLAARLAAMSDDELAALTAGTEDWRASVHGGQTGVVEVDGAKVFVKRLSLTDIERETPGSTANLFGLPGFYQYGVGSAGFGAWRELEASLKASGWVLSGACPYFPLVYHWRVLPKTPLPALVPRHLEWLEQAAAYWNGSEAVQARLDAISAASASIVMLIEHVADSLERCAEAGITADLFHRHAVVGFEPDPIFVDDADDRDWNVETAGGQRCDPIERAIRRRVEDVVATDRGYPGVLILTDNAGLRVQGHDSGR